MATDCQPLVLLLTNRQRMSAANGLLIITCVSKIAASLTIASKRVVKNLYIHYHPDIKEPIKYEGISKVSLMNLNCVVVVYGYLIFQLFCIGFVVNLCLFYRSLWQH